METTARIVNDLNDYLTEAVKSTTSDLNLAMNTDSLSTTTDPTNSSISQDGNPTVFRATITSIYILIFVVGLVGNIITCTVIKRNKSMHTATNYYLFNLAITDMLILVSVMPFDVYSTWYPSQYPATGSVCVLQGLIAETSTNVVILTISCFTIERYIAICHPFRQQAMSKLSRAIKFIMGIWVASFLTALPQSSQFGLVDIKGHVYCTVDSQDNIFTFAMSTLIFFVSPMTLICVLYVLIGLKLQQSSRVMAKFSHRANRPSANNNHINNAVVQGGSQSRSGQKAKDSTLASVTYGPVERQHQPSGSGSRKSQRRIIKLLIAVAVSFFLCWAPFHAQRLLSVFGTGENKEAKSHTIYMIYRVVNHISGVTFLLSTCINPLLYSVMSYKFRSAFKNTIGSTCFKFNWKKRWSSRNTGSWRLTTTTTTHQRPQMETNPNVVKRDGDVEAATILPELKVIGG